MRLENRGLWRKAKALNRKSSSSVGPIQKDRGRISARCYEGYYTGDGKLIYAGRVGTGMPAKVLADLRRSLDPLAGKT